VRNLGPNLHAAGPLKAITLDEAVHALNGYIDVNMNNVHYAGVESPVYWRLCLALSPQDRNIN
jgi:hypothetical protein